MKGMGGHHSADADTVEWLTPPDILAALGGPESFDLDPCAPITRPWPMAVKHYTMDDDGLICSWQVATNLLSDGTPCHCNCHCSGAQNAAMSSLQPSSRRAAINLAGDVTVAGNAPTLASGGESDRHEAASTPASNAQESLLPIESASRSGSSGAQPAKQSGQQHTSTFSRRYAKASQGLAAGAAFASAPSLAHECLRIAQTLPKQGALRQPSLNTPNLRKAEKQNAARARSTTNYNDSGVHPSHSLGQKTIGLGESHSGTNAAPTAETKGSLPKTISSQSFHRNSPELSSGTSSRHAARATHENPAETHSRGYPAISASTESCRTCVESGCHAKAHPARVFLNPPYSSGVIGKWMARLAEHGRGVGLIFARTETAIFHEHVWRKADALLFLEGRLFFHRPDGSRAPHNAGAPSVLCAYGEADADCLNECGIPGSFVPLKLRTLIFGFSEPGTWIEEVKAILARANRPMTLAGLYKCLADSPKARRNRHWKEKVRQTLQRGPFEPLGGGAWAIA